MPLRRTLTPRAALVAAVAALPLPACAASYDLTGVTLDVPTNTNTYTAADTLNTSTVTFTSTVTATLAPAVNLAAGTTAFTNAGSLTLTGPLSGSASFLKSNTGSLILTSPSPSFTGRASVLGGTLRLLDPLALGPASAATPITFAGTLDVSGSLPVRPIALNNALLENPDAAHPVTIFSLAIANSGTTSISFNSLGDITFSAPIPFAAASLYKNGGDTVTYSAPATFYSGITAFAGTLRLGINAPFTGSSRLFINGAGDVELLNNNLNSTSVIPASASLVGSGVIGGAGSILSNAYVPSMLTKVGTGTLTLTLGQNFAGTKDTLDQVYLKAFFDKPEKFRRVLDATFGVKSVDVDTDADRKRKIAAFIYWNSFSHGYDFHFIVQHADGHWSGQGGRRDNH